MKAAATDITIDQKFKLTDETITETLAQKQHPEIISILKQLLLPPLMRSIDKTQQSAVSPTMLTLVEPAQVNTLTLHTKGVTGARIL